MTPKTKSKLTILALASLMVLAGCEPPHPEKIEKTSNGMTIMRLASIEGCGLYRIDQGNGDRDVYTTICPATGRTQTQWTESCGKSCSRDVQVATVRKED